MIEILENNKETKKYLDSLPKIYAVYLWASYGILEVPWTEKFNYSGVPLVYDYYDGNGCFDEYHLKPINRISSGGFFNWYHNKELAVKVCDMLNNKIYVQSSIMIVEDVKKKEG